MTTKGPKVTSESPSASTAFASNSRPSSATAHLPGALAGILAFGVLLILALVAPRAQAADPFPGEGFLPDGMAWEKVSPADKNGYDIQWELSQAAADGDGVVYMSYGTFLDSLSGVGLGNYLGERTANGWQSKAVMPPHAAGLSSTPVTEFASDDLSKTIAFSSNAVTPDATFGVDSLYLRDNATDTFTLLNPGPGTGPSDAHFIAATPDAAYVVFEDARQLDPDAAAGETNVYVWHDGGVELAGYLPGDATPAGGSSRPAMNRYSASGAISPDGSTVVFEAEDDLYARIDGSTTVELSASEATTPGADGTDEFLAMSVDGSKVFFRSTESLTDDSTAEDHGAELYQYDFNRPQGSRLRDLSVVLQPGEGSGQLVRGFGGIAEDGGRAYFVTDLDLTTGTAADSGARYIYRWDDGPGNGTTKLVAQATTKTKFLDPSGSAGPISDPSADGDTLAFRSRDQLTADPVDNGANGLGQIYVYDAETETLTCASCRTDGGLTTHETVTQPNPLGENDFLSADGSRVVFSTAERLVPGDTNSAADVYMWDGEPHLISSGRSAETADFVDLSDSGDSIFFTTREQLVGADADTLRDIYVARVGGGLASQVAPVPPVECDGDDCQGEPSGSPEPEDVGSAEFTGPGNPPGGQERTCRALARKADRLARRVQSLRGKSKRVRNRARRASGKRAKRLQRRARRISARAQRLQREKRAGRREARACRSGR